MLRWVNRLALVIGLTACGGALGQPAMPEPPAPVVERTVTIRLVDPDGEPVIGLPMVFRTAFDWWRGDAVREINQALAAEGKEPWRPDWFGAHPTPLVSDSNGEIQAKVRFIEGDWRFIASYQPVFQPYDEADYPDYDPERIRDYARRFKFWETIRCDGSIDLGNMKVEIRFEPRIQVRVVVNTLGRLDANDLAINLLPVDQDSSVGVRFPSGWFRDQFEREVQKNGEHQHSRTEELSAHPGRDHVLMLQSDPFTHLCWLIPGAQIEEGSDLGRFEFNPRDATGMPGARVFPKAIDECSGFAEPNEEDFSNYTGLAFVAIDGSFFVAKALSPDNNFRWPIVIETDDRWNVDVYVPPGEYYIIDATPYPAGPHRGMHYAFLIELLRGNKPDDGEIPMLTVVKGKNPYTPLESADLHNALKAWYDKRFPTFDFPGFD